jgi:P protein
MVAFLTSTPEKVLERRQLAVPIAEPRIYNFPKLPTSTRINATLSGAFLPSETKTDFFDYKQNKHENTTTRRKKVVKEKENYIKVYLQTDTERILTPPKIFGITAPDQFDLTNTTKIPIMFDIGEENFEDLHDGNEKLQLVILSNFTKTPEEQKQEMPLIFTYDLFPINKQIGIIFAAFVLIFLYALIIWEVSFIIFLIKAFLLLAINVLLLLKTNKQ